MAWPLPRLHTETNFLFFPFFFLRILLILFIDTHTLLLIEAVLRRKHPNEPLRLANASVDDYSTTSVHVDIALVMERAKHRRVNTKVNIKIITYCLIFVFENYRHQITDGRGGIVKSAGQLSWLKLAGDTIGHQVHSDGLSVSSPECHLSLSFLFFPFLAFVAYHSSAP